MGIFVSRPTMRGAEDRRVRNTLKRHADLMAQYQADGLSREDASRQAFIFMRNNPKG